MLVLYFVNYKGCFKHPFFFRLDMFTSKELKKLRKFIKQFTTYRPNNLDSYIRAFTHKSYDPTNQANNNETLEFLGDSILNAVVSIYLYKKYNDFDEGKLTKIRSNIVSTENLTLLAKNYQLELFYKKKVDVLNEKHMYADTLEAFIGAFYLDKGFNKTYKFIEKRLLSLIDVNKYLHEDNDFKSKLTILAQKSKIILHIDTKKIDNTSELFLSRIYLNHQVFAEAIGLTKKQAEQSACANALKKLNN